MYEIPAKKIHSLQQLFNRIVASRTTGDKLPKFALLAGAGCSVSSGVVSGKHIIDILQKYNYILQSDGADSELLARWNHDSETLETFIAKVEHLIHPDTLQKYINDNNEELQRQFEDLFFDMKMPDSECNMFENCSIIEEISDDNQSEDADASHCLSHSESTECDLEYALKDSIIKTCLALGKAGQPIKLELFALKLKENGIDYHKYGFSKLIQFLKTQSSYLSIEGIETRKFVVLSEYSES